ncbi:MAG: hypothetical protein GY870_09915 [archaeon]|nr:hypothetical protein [archaeon]
MNENIEIEKIEWNKCNKCGYLQHKTHLRCLKCKYTQFETVFITGDCKLLTFTILKAIPLEFRNKKSYALGIVEFKNGIKALGQITTTKNLKIGMKLKPIYQKICENLNGEINFGFIFEPI